MADPISVDRVLRRREFFHAREVERNRTKGFDGIDDLAIGDVVDFELSEDRQGRRCAVRVKAVDKAE